VLLVDQAAVQQIEFINRIGRLPRIERGAGYAGQNALLNHGNVFLFIDP
jgi:hypothetical protein